MTDAILDDIEAAANGELRGLAGKPFAHPADTLKLVAEVRRLRAAERAAVLAERDACLALAAKKAAELRRDRDAFYREPDREAGDDMEWCATVADDIIEAIRSRP